MNVGTDNPIISLEYFPAKSADGLQRLMAVHDALSVVRPAFCSVTYGAGGSTRTTTLETVTRLAAAGCEVAPHLSFGQDDHRQIHQLLTRYQALGVRRIVALRGDAVDPSAKPVYASTLVSFIREHFGDTFDIAVAAYPEVHPQANNLQSDVSFLKQKLDSGAERAITQFFFNPDAYFWFIDACDKAGIKQPIVPGIMPIRQYRKIQSFAFGCGAEIPRWLLQRLESLESDPAGLETFCDDFMADFCRKLLEYGAPGLHFYTMNQSAPTLAIADRLGLIRKTSFYAQHPRVHQSLAGKRH